MAVVGIVMKFFQIVISIAVGLAAGCIPIVGYNIGAGLKARARRLFTLLLSAEAAVGAVALLIVEVFPRPLIFLFGAADESVYYTDFAVHSFRIYLCMMILALSLIHISLLMCGESVRAGLNLGTINGFGAVAATVCGWLGVSAELQGESLLPRILQ